METRWIKRSVGVLVAVSVVLAGVSASYAAPITLTLTRTSVLTNVNDAAGTWQFDGGTVASGETVVGRYARVKRTVLGGGTDNLNTAILTITIFLFGLDPPESLTLQGSHSFNTGEERGSISGASPGLAGAEGITFHGPSTALTFDVP